MDRKKKEKYILRWTVKSWELPAKELTAEDTFDANSTILQHDASSNKYSLGVFYAQEHCGYPQESHMVLALMNISQISKMRYFFYIRIHRFWELFHCIYKPFNLQIQQ